ncbi:hypothetical protein BJY24_005140 [Nocardia transvalensis]|uniref:Uncharacterized protein n=1 Tax=Nocardia transvalensis TaxID=37333 RepID=A0A7W9PIB9_9NOCA|nr:hypothetical protein [Nocardia transvalensis]MBB5916228.1 hypothetical protein [Nocardia transvalensis]
MRTTLRSGAASVAAAALVTTAASAAADPAPAPAAGTGSSAVDSGSAAAQTGVFYLQHGNVIGLLTLLVVTPFQILTTGVCDLATGSGLPSPCTPGAR